ncbi:MAG: hypothetical protein ATN35_00590 [Epulopiscium sp. Nele67-Bin004]|nr:MAG: hypothetical protein ATN35_00590 [Epulopiscium sp. Nele67-Bin004]
MDKNKVNIILAGQIYTIQGTESNEHIEQVAAKINKNYEALRSSMSGSKYTQIQIAMLVALNMGSECMKIENEYEYCIKELDSYKEQNMSLLERIEELNLELAQEKAKTSNGRKN